MISTVTYDMRYFLFVFTISILAFSDALLTMSMGNVEVHQFIQSVPGAIVWVYLACLGEFGMEFG